MRADRLLDDLWAGAPTQPQHAPVEGRAAAPRARRPVADRRRRRRLPARGRARRGRRAPRAARRRRGDGALDAGDDAAAARAQRGRARAASAASVLPAAGDWAAPHRARLEEARAQLLETRFAARLRLGEDVIGELEAAVATRAVPGGAVGAADHRALPRRPPGRRAGRLPARPRAARGRPRPRARPAAEGARAPGPDRRTRRSRARAGGNLPSLAAELVGRDGEIAALRDLLARAPPRRGRRPGRHRQDGRRDRDRTHAGRRSPSGSSGSRPRRPPTTCSTRSIAALDVDRRRGGAARALAPAGGGADPRQLRARASTPPRRSRSACSTRRPTLRVLCTSQVALERRRRGRVRARAARARRRRRALHAPRRPARRPRAGTRAVPVARRPAARDRARGGAHADAVGRGDRAPARRPLQPC